MTITDLSVNYLRVQFTIVMKQETSINQSIKIYGSAQRKHPAIEELLALFQYRDLIFQLTRRDIVARYKRSVLGIAWTMLNPLGIMIVMSVVFSNIFNRVESYPTYLLTALVCYTTFQQSTVVAMNSTVWGSKLLEQIYLPRTSFVLSTIFASMVNFALGLIPLFLIMLITGVPIRWTALLVPIGMLLLCSFSLGFGFLLSTLAVFFPDIAEIYPVLMRAWMYLTPIFVPVEILEKVLDGWVLRLNPLHHIIKIFRDLLYYGTLPSLMDWGIAALVSFGALLLGWYFFCVKADNFAYHA